MKVFLSALEASPEFYYINSKIDNYKYNLMSFYYIKKEEVFKEIIKKLLNFVEKHYQKNLILENE